MHIQPESEVRGEGEAATAAKDFSACSWVDYKKK